MQKQSTMPMSDIHSHVLFGIDDGSRDLQMSLHLLRLAEKEGIRDLVCTSHSYGRLENYEKKFYALQSSAQNAGIQIHLYQGCEILCDAWGINETIDDLNRHYYPTINHTPYALIEFYPDISSSDILYCARKLCAETDSKFILAHVERYRNLEGSWSTIDQLQNMGCLLQLNAYSLVEEKRKATKGFARQLLKEKRISFLGSDCHRPEHRPPIVQSGLRYIHETCEPSYAKSICFENARKLLFDRSLV